MPQPSVRLSAGCAFAQEDWTTNPFARTKFIKGKIVYQRAPDESVYYARPYAYRDGVLSIPDGPEREEPLPCAEPFPPDQIKISCD